MFDINSLKPVNDTYGHSEGDKLIIRICKTVKSYLGSSDIFFRLSGDEFIIIFTEHPLQNVKEVLQKILLELKNTASKEGRLMNHHLPTAFLNISLQANIQ